MGIANKLTAATKARTGLPCSVSVLLEKLNDEDREALENILSTSNSKSHNAISSRQIYEIVVSEGHDVAYTSIANHRRRACRCFAENSSAGSVSKKKG